MESNELDAAFFGNLVEEAFEVLDQDRQITLISVELLTEHAPSERAPFALLFSDPHEPPLPQATYALNSAGGETLTIFLVPVEAAGGRTIYEAIFN